MGHGDPLWYRIMWPILVTLIVMLAITALLLDALIVIQAVRWA